MKPRLFISILSIFCVAASLSLTGCGGGEGSEAAAANEQLRQKAMAGDADAAYQLGEYYAAIENPSVDDQAESVKWFRVAALNGHPDVGVVVGELQRQLPSDKSLEIERFIENMRQQQAQ